MRKLSLVAITISCSVVVGLGWWFALDRPDIPLDVVYQRNCSVCHGQNGSGDGPAAELLDPRPRDFRLGSFRFVTTDNQRPTREDLFRTITQGLPGTAMPPWKHLPEKTRWALVDLILEFNRQDWIDASVEQGATLEEAIAEADEGLLAGTPIEIPPEPPVTTAGLQRGQHLFVQNCATCHGEDDRGKVDPNWRTAEGYPIRSRDFRRGVFKGGRESRQMFHRVAGGIPGTPMPAFGASPEHWDIIHYVQTLSDPHSQVEAEVLPIMLSATKLLHLPRSVNDPLWQKIETQVVTLFPISESGSGVDRLSVRAARDDRTLTLLVEWSGRDQPSDDDEDVDEPVVAAAAFLPGPSFPLSSKPMSSVSMFQSLPSTEDPVQCSEKFLQLFAGDDWRENISSEDVDVSSGRKDGRWRVQFRRSLADAPIISSRLARISHHSPWRGGEEWRGCKARDEGPRRRTRAVRRAGRGAATQQTCRYPAPQQESDEKCGLAAVSFAIGTVGVDDCAAWSLSLANPVLLKR